MTTHGRRSKCRSSSVSKVMKRGGILNQALHEMGLVSLERRPLALERSRQEEAIGRFAESLSLL